MRATNQEPSMNPYAPAPATAKRPGILRIGRFSTGNEEQPDAPAKLCIGRFSTGNEERPDASAKLRVGRFSTGSERRADAPAGLRRGSFADGYAAPRLTSLQASLRSSAPPHPQSGTRALNTISRRNGR
jgi:hypothetical protein